MMKVESNFNLQIGKAVAWDTVRMYSNSAGDQRLNTSGWKMLWMFDFDAKEETTPDNQAKADTFQ